MTFCHVHHNQCHNGCPYRSLEQQRKAPVPAPHSAPTERVIVVQLKASGMVRIPDSRPGQTFVVDKFTDTVDDRGLLAHVRDYRYDSEYHHGRYAIWTLGPEDYEIIKS